MRAGRWFGIPVRISPAAFLMAALAVWLGEGMRLGIMSGSIILHELMHIAAARLMHVRVTELELMPMGGAARMENLWGLRPGQAVAVAMAGPLTNLLLAVCAAAFCWWGMLPAEWAEAVIGQNLMILAFNLLPALPMDGGRILCGLLSRRLSPAGAARAGVCSACLMAAALCGLTAYGAARGRINITLPAAALFLLSSARREMVQAEGAAVMSMIGRAGELREERVMPVRWLAAFSDATVRETAVRIRPRYIHRIEVYDRSLESEGTITEQAIMRALLHDVDEKLGEICKKVKKKEF